MTNSPIPPPPPVSPPSQQGQQAAAPVGRQPFRDVPVTQVPASLQRSGQSIQIPGKVVSSLPVSGNAVSREIRISTSNGDIVVQANANLAPDTDVTVNIYVQKGNLLATLTLPRTGTAPPAATSPSADMPPPALPSSGLPPPLQAGDTVSALYLPEASTATAPSANPAQIDQALAQTLMQIADIIDELQLIGLQGLPRPLPLPPQAMSQLATAPNVLAALQGLPAEEQQQLAAYVQRPDVQDALNRLLPSSRGAELDDNVLQIIRSQAGARMGQGLQGANLQSPGAQAGAQERAPQPALALLKGLLPLLETLQNPPETPGGTLQPMMAGIARGAALGGTAPQGLLQVKIISILPPNTGQSAGSDAAGKGMQQGVLESVSPSGYPVLRVGGDLYVLKTQGALPPGSIIVFQTGQGPEELPAPGQAAGQSGGTGLAESFDPLTSTGWPALQEALNSISAVTTPGLAAALRATIPAATERLPPTALFFLSSLRSGDIESWLGEPLLQALRQNGKAPLADRLVSDFEKIASQAKDLTPDGWRATSMPLLHDDQVSQLQFFVRQQQDEKADRTADGTAQPMTRFILNLRLSRLGDMQLDGLLHKKRLDMILRSAAPLPAGMRQDLASRFSGALDQVKMAGGISFQTKAEYWVRIEAPRQGTTA